MATVRLHSQHHPAGDLRPATPTCCSCSCCCVGAAVGTLAILPVMIVRSAMDQPAAPATTAAAASGEVSDAPEPAPTTSARRLSPWVEGLAAFALAAVPFLVWLLLPEGGGVLMVVAGLTILALTAWAASRSLSANHSISPPLVTTFAVLPLAIAVEFYSATQSEYSYAVTATVIGTAVFGLGALYLWSARRP
ncbi:MAG: hypothetical protein QM779_11385 [Propionicimonas sp.]|uniref:hypothetical protein n=1 Tax=Propionicimonas sp. TaxID=1955623 RepID=UPI003D11FB51